MLLPLLLLIPLLQVANTAGAILSEILIIALILAVIAIIFFFGRLLAGVVVNIILGFLAIWAVNMLFGIGIAFTILTIILVAIFGLPAVFVIILLKIIGISLPF